MVIKMFEWILKTPNIFMKRSTKTFETCGIHHKLLNTMEQLDGACLSPLLFFVRMQNWFIA